MRRSGKGRICHPFPSHVILILVLYTAATLVITYPLPFHLSTHTAQAEEGWAFDALQYIWTMWWTDKALFDLHTSPANLRCIQFPSGVYHPFLLAVDYVGFAGLPITRLASPTVAHNLLTLLAFILNGLTAYLFCLDLTGNRLGSFVGGLVFAFLPNRMAHAIGGHVDLISTYWFPLYGLLLMRLLRRPSVPLALLCGLSLSLSAWVQVLYIPYFLIPLTIAILAHVSLAERRSLRPALPALLLTLGVTALTAAPFLLPFLLESLQGTLGYLQEGGATVFSADLLSFLAPSPTNPVLRRLGLIPPFAQRVVPENFVLTEVLFYLGLCPLALAIWAMCRRPRRAAVWAILSAGTAVLSLGPLLRVNGYLVAFEVDNLRSYVPLPYALLMRLPGLALGRTPGRLGMTVGFGLALLVAYGWADLMERLGPRPRLGATALLSTLVMVEYLVYWPIPTLPLSVPYYLHQMPCSPGRGAVLNIPLTRRRVNQIALYHQSIHEQPLIGGRVFRDLPGPMGLDSFLQDLHLAPPVEDIIPRASPEAVAAVDRACGVGHVFLFQDYTEDADRVRAFLATALAPPVSTAQGLIIFRVPPGSATVGEPIYGLGHHWSPVEDWNGEPARWMPEQARLYIYAPVEQQGSLRFTALPLSTSQRLQIEANGTPLPPLVVGDWMTYTTPLLALRPGLNQITFRALNGCTPFVGDPRCTGPARAAGAHCNPYLRQERCLSILYQNIHFLPATAGPAENPLDIVLGERIRFLGYDLDGSAAPGQTLSLTLYWQALEANDQDYTIFVHLLGPDGDLLAQHDAPPLDDTYPTSRWVAGDVFLHRATLTIPAAVSPGRYDLLAGMYTYPDIKRLPVASDRPYARDGLIWLQSVEILP